MLNRPFGIVAGTMVNKKPLVRAAFLPPGTLFIPRLEKPTEQAPHVHVKHQIFRHGLYDAIRWALHVKYTYENGAGIGKDEGQTAEEARRAIERVLRWLDALLTNLLSEAGRVREVFVDAWNRLGRAINHWERHEPGNAGFETGETLTALCTITVGPYPAHIKLMVDDLDAAADAADPCVHLRRARESLRIKRARWEIEGLVTRMSILVHAKCEPDNAVRQEFIDTLSRFRERLTGINDEGFKKPVIVPTNALFKLAEQMLLEQKSPLVSVKVLVAKAARRL